MKYTDLAQSVPHCMGCKKSADGTIVLAHRNLSGWGLLFGRGIKALSAAGAFLCSECHQRGDGEGRNDSGFWELAVQRSLTWAWANGYLTMRTEVSEADARLR